MSRWETAMPVIAACTAGVYVGDLGLWALGRVAGQRALRWSWFPLHAAEVSHESMRKPVDDVRALKFGGGSREGRAAASLICRQQRPFFA
jgi:hypothetical protein